MESPAATVPAGSTLQGELWLSVRARPTSAIATTSPMTPSTFSTPRIDLPSRARGAGPSITLWRIPAMHRTLPAHLPVPEQRTCGTLICRGPIAESPLRQALLAKPETLTNSLMAFPDLERNTNIVPSSGSLPRTARHSRASPSIPQRKSAGPVIPAFFTPTRHTRRQGAGYAGLALPSRSLIGKTRCDSSSVGTRTGDWPGSSGPTARLLAYPIGRRSTCGTPMPPGRSRRGETLCGWPNRWDTGIRR